MISDADRRALFRELVAQPSGVRVKCVTGSMQPTVNAGDRVLVQACRGDQVRVGDVVLFFAGDGSDTLLLHRVTLRIPGLPYFFHAGDAAHARRPGIAHLSKVVGRADLPRRRPSARLIGASLVRGVRAGVGLVRHRRAR